MKLSRLKGECAGGKCASMGNGDTRIYANNRVGIQHYISGPPPNRMVNKAGQL